MPKRNPENGSEYVVVQAAQRDQDGSIIGREERLLDKVSPSDMIRLTNMLTDLRRNKIIKNAHDSGITATELDKKLDAFDARPIDRGDVTQWGILPHGVVEVLKCALRHDRPDASEEDLAKAVDDLGLSDEGMVRAAAGCLHIVLKPKEAAANPPDSGGQSALAPGSPTETGEQTPSA